MKSLKWISLALLLIQNALSASVLRAAATSAKSSERYSPQMTILFAEILKLLLSVLFILLEEKSVVRTLSVLNAHILQQPCDTLRLLVPAALYYAQNILLQLSAGHLPAAVFHVMYQGKTLVVALFSIVLLQKELSRRHWTGIATLALGLALVQTAGGEEKAQQTMANNAEQSQPLGLLYALIGCCVSGFAGVYFEKIMKKGPTDPKAASGPPPSMWVRNVQLALFSLMFGTFSLVQNGLDLENATRGFTLSVWLLVLNSAFGGLLVALVIKHADNILKGFACAIATVAAAFLSIPLFGFQLTFQFFLGTLVVVGSTLLYGGLLSRWVCGGEWWGDEPAFCASMRGRKKTDEGTDPDTDIELLARPSK